MSGVTFTPHPSRGPRPRARRARRRQGLSGGARLDRRRVGAGRDAADRGAGRGDDRDEPHACARGVPAAQHRGAARALSEARRDRHRAERRRSRRAARRCGRCSRRARSPGWRRAACPRGWRRRCAGTSTRRPAPPTRSSSRAPTAPCTRRSSPPAATRSPTALFAQTGPRLLRYWHEPAERAESRERIAAEHGELVDLVLAADAPGFATALDAHIAGRPCRERAPRAAPASSPGCWSRPRPRCSPGAATTSRRCC